MREHKYRAWDTIRKVMYSAEELGADQETLSPDGRGFINVSGASTLLSQYHTNLLPLEYTGLKDKNGKEIYEGDIVRSHYHNIIGKIVWDNDTSEGYTGFTIRYPDEVNPYKKWWTLEVIGNIYENKELLE